MRRDPLPPAFDLNRHLKELVRQVLPIFVVVSVIALIAYAIWGPEPKLDEIPDLRAPSRVGLLPVESTTDATGPSLPFDPAFVVPRPLDLARAPVAPRFDAPMGSPLGAFTYNAQPFLVSRHLGDDLNGIGGGNSDLGDPVHAAGDGSIVLAGWAGEGWGNVAILLHRLPDESMVTTLYGHLDRIRLPVGAAVRRGEIIGTVGNAGRRYPAHLHFEVRSGASLDPGPGYADGPTGRQSGEAFVMRHRGAPEDRQNEPVGGPWDTRLPRKAARDGEEPGMRFSTEEDAAPAQPVP